MDAFSDWVRQGPFLPNRALHDGDVGEVSDILLFEESIKIETKAFRNADLVPWVDGCASSGDRDGILGVTRIVWIYRDSETRLYKISKENLQYLFNSFGLERIRSLVPHGFSFQGGRSTPTKKQAFALLYGVALTYAWRYDYMTNRTEVVFEGDLYWRLTLQEVIQFQQRLGLHPLFMGIVTVIAMLRDLVFQLGSIDIEIASVESRTRHTVIKGWQAAAGSYAFLSAKMSGQAQTVAICENRYALMLQNLDWLSEFQWPQDIEKPSWLEKVAEEVDECSHFVRNALKRQEPYIRLLSKRVNIQLTALFNLISQQENRLSRSVAQDSRTLASATKDDSTAMKTLAAVTVVFLPGTFVAALFSMPLFQWDTHTKPHSAISEQFWIYWATTLPLTILTLALWFAWMRLQARRHQARDREDREALDHEVEDNSRSHGPGNAVPDTTKGSKQA